MKKFVLFVCAFMSTAFVHAQGLGDYMEIDGVPGFVFYLDESGEHGLVMSCPEITEKAAEKIEKRIKKKGLDVKVNNRLMIPGKAKKKLKVSSKDMKSYRKDLVSLLGDEGKQNRAIIEDYCKEKNLNIAIFKGQDFAAHLGDGWFIPGDKELMLFAEFYAGGTGKKNSVSFTKRAIELSNDPMVQSTLHAIINSGIFSSTIKDSKWGFRALASNRITGKRKALSFKLDCWFELTDKVKITKVGYSSIESVKLLSPISVCAVHEF